MLFAQVREDPMIELNVINKIINNSNNNESLSVACITSGGCTALSMLSKYIKVIDCVDINVEQNYLTELKLALCLYFDTKLDVVNFMQGTNNKVEINDLLSTNLLSVDAK